MDEKRKELTALAYELARARLTAARDPRELCLFTAQCFSQGPEDGVIAEIFRRIGVRDRFFVEIGAGDGRENTTRLLLTLGWSGIWIEGSPASCTAIRRDFAGPIAAGRLRLIEAMVTAENIEALLVEAGAPERFDYLSIDLDMNTYYVWQALGRYRARTACIEYNASIPPSWEFVVPYDPWAVWDGSTWYGAGLKSLELLGKSQGYELVGCDFYGVNAFFAAADEPLTEFVAPFTAEKHYQPPNYFAPFRHGHWPASPKLTNPAGA
ncbi:MULTISPECIES: hypothetical protein [Rhodomicrobium]|uniref:hypothetical protein n=1 Tax=Rhodomicrobium TaxID=1068 RepID=UPI000B4B0704|nr:MULTISPECIES: hypothetical protein [Rhodomicrobium]